MFSGSIKETKIILLHASLRECRVVTPFEMSPMILSRGWYLEVLHSLGRSTFIWFYLDWESLLFPSSLFLWTSSWNWLFCFFIPNPTFMHSKILNVNLFSSGIRVVIWVEFVRSTHLIYQKITKCIRLLNSSTCPT